MGDCEGGLTSPARYAGLINPPPVLFLNGRWDTVVPAAAATLLHEAAHEPKEIVWTEAGHHLPPNLAGHALEWLEDQLSPGR